jgi:hypothetical protein
MGYYAYTLFCKERKITAAIVIAIAFLFHKSIILLVPVLLLMNYVKLKRNSSIVLFLLSIVVVMTFGYSIITYCYVNFLELLGYGHKLVDALSYKLTKIKSGYGVLLRLIIYGSMLLLVSDKINSKRWQRKDIYNARYIFVVLLFLDILASYTLQEIGRVSILFSFAVFPMLAIIYDTSRYKKAFFMIVAFWLLLDLYMKAAGNIYDVFPYRSIL